MKKYDKYTFFWNGPFSQWYESHFELDDMKFNCCEQYMMYKKAMLFNDTGIASLIMATDSPKKQKELGRQVHGFIVEIWEQVARDVVFRANMAKFTQDEFLIQTIADTEGTLIVEASPFDKIWGIGLDEATAKVTPIEQWKGRNWLGLVLTEVRESFENLLIPTEQYYDADEGTYQRIVHNRQ